MHQHQTNEADSILRICAQRKVDVAGDIAYRPFCATLPYESPRANTMNSPQPVTARQTFEQLLSAATQLINTTPAMSEFAAVPDDLQYRHCAPVTKPVIDCLHTAMPEASHRTQPLIDALQAVIPHAQWRTTYTAAQVGARFVNTYGFIELYGPTGHYVSEQSRAFIGYWGADLFYPPHSHEAEEIYFVAAGSAAFAIDDQPAQMRSVEEVQVHTAFQSHSMQTGAGNGVLCLVLWRGPGLADNASLNEG